MNVDYFDFEPDLKRALATRFHPERVDDVARSVKSRATEVMGLRWGSSPLDARDLGTLKVFYDKLEKTMVEAEDTAKAFDARGISQSIVTLAQKHYIAPSQLDAQADRAKVSDMIAPLQQEPRIKSNGTAFENNVGIFRSVGTHGFADRERLRSTPRTPEPLIAKRVAPNPAPTVTAAEVEASPSPASVAAPKTLAAAPAREEKTHRDARAIKGDYEQAWAKAGEAMRGQILVITLTGSDSAAPWLRIPPEKFKTHMDDARATAREFRVATKVEPWLKKVEALHGEYHAAKAAEPARSRA